MQSNAAYFVDVGSIGWTLLVTVNCAKVHVVGDKLGWNVPFEPGFFDEWAKKNTFVVDDELLFQYHQQLDTVEVVEKDDYENCTNTKVIRSLVLGNSTVPLEKPGDYYFFSSVGKHCEAGQKLHITTDGSKSNR
ncbi:unnamed protein product [Sphenostylis stenocarpa]|uniref:Phytocyanin domain-containing protein n=1 Tax=Sphenostylis stenocarpa TaxID=92480 RepID=A0AA86VBM2_9FABA|nr:unnamed protein product [Sphenostylis stenocarpa]